MSVIGKKNSTLKKQNVQETTVPITGIKNLVFWHEASAGETSIPYANLVFPSAVIGETNPLAAEILSASLGLFKNNVTVFSSLNGELMVGLTVLVTNSQITFINGYEAEEGEIFKVTFKNQAISGVNVVDARALTSNGTLTAGDVDYNVGETFRVGSYPDFQIGEVMVFVDGILQHRNVSNATAGIGADGNYEEVHATGGFGTIIRFNEPFADDQPIQVMSRSLISERPDISMMQIIENLGGQLDSIVEHVAQDLGIDPSELQSLGPNSVDLKAFGDCVGQNKKNIETNTTNIATNTADIAALDIETKYQTKFLSANVGSTNNDIADLRYNNLEIGKTYRISAQIDLNCQSTLTNQTGIFKYNDGVNTVFKIEWRENSSSNGGQTTGNSGIFVATSTTLTAQFVAANSVDLIGNGTKDKSWSQLEELPNHEIVTQWT